MRSIVLHLKDNAMGRSLDAPHLALYKVIADSAFARGVAVTRRLRDADIRIGTRRVLDDRFEDGQLHIIDDRCLVAPHVLNAAMAYFPRFWHLDPQGTRAFSSIAQRDYDPEDMPYERARVFFETMRARYVDRRQSRYPQPGEHTAAPDGAIAVFFQGPYPRIAGSGAVDDMGMLRAVLRGAGDRPVTVKPHPRATDADEIARLHRMALADPRLHVSDGNVHDLLRAACVTVSINSTVALEGYLHWKPAILFGQADFHHRAFTVSDDLPFDQALEAALAQEGGHAKYLAWYFLRQCLDLNADDLEARIWAILDPALDAAAR